MTSSKLTVFTAVLLFAAAVATARKATPKRPALFAASSFEKKEVDGIEYDQLFEELYSKLGYEACSQAGWIRLQRKAKSNCTAVFERLYEDAQKEPVYPPPSLPPSYLRDQYTLNRSIELSTWYWKDEYTKSNSFDKQMLSDWEQGAKEKRPGVGAGVASTNNLHDALGRYPVAGKAGIVYGTRHPWAETTLIAEGAKHVTSIEYIETKFEHERIVGMRPHEIAQLFLQKKWREVDFGLSFSTMEHYGLGRYGDPLDPEGDLKGMQQLSCLIKPKGLLFLGVPTGVDCIVWNAHRIYGHVRFPLLTADWKLLDIYYSHYVGGQDVKVKRFSDIWHGDCKLFDREPIIVLQNMRDKACV